MSTRETPRSSATGACAICCRNLEDTADSDEHILPNAIGGRLKVRGFICKDCNSAAGETWDAKLAAQLNPLSLFFGIVRERGVSPPMNVTTTAGERLRIESDGSLSMAKPNYSVVEDANGAMLSISARSRREMRQMLTGARRNYPLLDVEKLLGEAQIERTMPEGLLHHRLELGGEVAGRSIVKSALAFAHHAGLPLSQGDAIDYLRDASVAPPFGYYYDADLIAIRPGATPFHCVAMSADPKTGLVLGYIEYFGIHRVIVCLGRNYRGPGRNAAYSVDPCTGARLDLAVALSFHPDELSKIYGYETFASDALVAAFEAVISPALERKAKRARDRMVGEAFDHALANCGAKMGEVLTKEHLDQMSALFVDGIRPLLTKRSSR